MTLAPQKLTVNRIFQSLISSSKIHQPLDGRRFHFIIHNFQVLLAKSTRCFTEPEESFCGNLRVEGDEECDAGLLGSEDTDSCCDENCKLRANAKCSDKNSPCCVGN
jgi:hypothetical protein